MLICSTTLGSPGPVRSAVLVVPSLVTEDSKLQVEDAPVLLVNRSCSGRMSRGCLTLHRPQVHKKCVSFSAYKNIKNQNVNCADSWYFACYLLWMLSTFCWPRGGAPLLFWPGAGIPGTFSQDLEWCKVAVLSSCTCKKCMAAGILARLDS